MEALAEQELAEHFEAVIGRGDRVEPRDWMPAPYRATLVRQTDSTTDVGGVRVRRPKNKLGLRIM